SPASQKKKFARSCSSRTLRMLRRRGAVHRQSQRNSGRLRRKRLQARNVFQHSPNYAVTTSIAHPPCVNICAIRGGFPMRDIRGDLQVRANLIKERMSAAQQQFENLTEQLKLEHETKLTEIKAELEAVKFVMEAEHRRVGNSGSTMPQPKHPQPLPPVTEFRPDIKLAS